MSKPFQSRQSSHDRLSQDFKAINFISDTSNTHIAWAQNRRRVALVKRLCRWVCLLMAGFVTGLYMLDVLAMTPKASSQIQGKFSFAAAEPMITDIRRACRQRGNRLVCCILQPRGRPSRSLVDLGGGRHVVKTTPTNVYSGKVGLM